MMAGGSIAPYKQLARLYDLGWSGFVDSYVDFLTDLLRSKGIRSARALDLGCGTGRLAVALAEQGHRVHGLDKSPEMVEVACAKVRAGIQARFLVQDMERFSVEGSFDLVTCTFGTLNYLLSPDSVGSLFSRVERILFPRGMFVFDTNTANGNTIPVRLPDCLARRASLR